MLSTYQAALKETDRLLTKALGISSGKFAVLITLLYDGPLTMSALAGRTRTGSSNVTTLVRRLLRQGLVEKENSESDRRCVQIRLTDVGDYVIRMALPVARLIIEKTFAKLDPQDKVSLDRILYTISENVKTLKQTRKLIP